MNCSVAIKILNALRSPHNNEELVSSGNIILPRLRHLEFHRPYRFDDRNDALIYEFLDELQCFLIFRSKVPWDGVEVGRWQQKDDSKVLECLKFEPSLYNENGCYKDYVRDFDCLTDEDSDGEPTSYRFHYLDERREDAEDAEITWMDLDYPLEDDDGLDAEPQRGG